MKRKGIALMLSLALMFGSVATALPVITSAEAGATGSIIAESEIPLRLFYDEEASHGIDIFENTSSYSSDRVNPDTYMAMAADDDWERWSLPIGNGYFGANLFGRTETERIQITEKTLSNPYSDWATALGGLNSFSETYIDFGHTNSDVTDYIRELDIKTAVSKVGYTYGGVKYSREYFTSYPDRALVIKLDADTEEALGFTLRPTVPYEQEYARNEGDGASKTGTVESSVDENGVGCITLSGTMGYYGIDFVGLYRVYTDGTVTASTTQHTYTDTAGHTHTDTDGTIVVEGAKSAYIVVTLGTDYELCSEMFTAGDKSKPTHATNMAYAINKVTGFLSSIEALISGKSHEEAYQLLKERHISDYSSLFGRVSLDLGYDPADTQLTTDELLAKYKTEGSAYLESLYFQYGRYLLISSSRSGTLPTNLQGVWNRYNFAPWASGFWHNINNQMIYWPAFSTNLAETFVAYTEFNNAYMAQAEKLASSFVDKYYPDKSGEDGGNGWVIGVGTTPYYISGQRSPGHMAFNNLLFVDYYRYTKDENILPLVYEVLANAARYITKVVIEDEEGHYLLEYVDSPEQYVNGVWYYTNGTTYAQSLAYMNNYELLQCAKDIGIDLSDETLLSTEDYSILKTVMEQIDKYDPIIIGLSGQIKEFREEEYYGDLGEKEYVHISHLLGLHPGTLINEADSPHWLDAAINTLNYRGTGNTVGWGWDLRMNMWARVQDGNMAYEMLNGQLNRSVATNLWSVSYYFQVDGNIGATAGMAEMLLQSQSGYIQPLAAMPDGWTDGSYTGLTARGDFEVSAKWANSRLTDLNVTSGKGEICRLYYNGINGVTVTTKDGAPVKYITESRNLISFPTKAGETYLVAGFGDAMKISAPDTIQVSHPILGNYNVAWTEVEGATRYNVYAAVESEPKYTKVGSTTGNTMTYTPAEGKENARMTFAVTAVSIDGTESVRAFTYINPDDLSVNVTDASGNILPNGSLQVTVKATGSIRNYKLWEKKAGQSEYSLVLDSPYPIITYNGYDKSASYGVTLISKYEGYAEESELYPVTDLGGAVAVPSYNPSNILEGKEFIPTEEALNCVHLYTTQNNATSYGYPRLTDGNYVYNQGRFATYADSDRIVDGTVDLGGAYILSELGFYPYQDKVADFAGANLKIELMLDGVVVKTFEYADKAKIAAAFGSLKSNYVGQTYYGVNMENTLADAIRIYQYGDNVSYDEITCAGIYAPAAADRVTENNILLGKTFVPAINADWVSADFQSWAQLTDNDNHYRTGRLSFKGDKTLDMTVDLEGVYTLDDIRLYYYYNMLDHAGKDIEIFTYYGGEWTSVARCESNEEIGEHVVTPSATNPSWSGYNWIEFNLGGVKASKIRIYQSSGTSTGIGISYYEIQATGTFIKHTEETAINNILLGKDFVPQVNADALYSAEKQGWAQLTDGNFSYQNGRLTFKPGNELDIIADLGGTYRLDDLKLHHYSADYRQTGKDLLIQVYYKGQWTTVVKCDTTDEIISYVKSGSSNGAGKSYMVFDMGGVIAEKIRVYQSDCGGYLADDGNTYGISYYEIESAGARIEEYYEWEDTETNMAGSSTITLEGATVGSSPLANITDGNVTTVFEPTDTDGTYSMILTLPYERNLYTLNIYGSGAKTDLVNGVRKTRSADTTVEVYINGAWRVIASGVELAAEGRTAIDIHGVSTNKIRITFKNTYTFDNGTKPSMAIADIYLTSGACTDRTELLDAYIALEAVQSDDFGFAEIKKDRLCELLALLMDTDADQAKVDGYTATVLAAKDKLTAGAPVTKEYGDFASYNLSLGGDIGFNFYGALREDIETLFPEGYVYLEYADGTIEKMPLSELDRDANGRYVIKLNMAAAEMTESVKMRLILDGDNCGEYIEQSVADYAASILADPSYEENNPGINALLVAMLNYGGYAQTYFDYNTENMANSGIDTELGDVTVTDKVSVSGSATGLVPATWTLTLESKVEAKIFFTLEEGAKIEDYIAMVALPTGELVSLDIEKVGNRYRVIVDNIVSAYLDNYYTVILTNTIDSTSVQLSISAMCYVAEALHADNAALVNVAKALKLYSDAANNYFGKEAE